MTPSLKLPAIPKAIPSAIPYDLVLIRSRVLGQDVAIVRNQFIQAPAGALKLTWKEAMALVGSGATPVAGFIPQPAPEPPAQAPTLDAPQMELF